MIFLNCGLIDMGAPDPKKIYVAVSIANRGRRTVTVSKVYFKKRNSGTSVLLLWHEFLKGEQEVKEGKSIMYLADQEQSDWPSIRWVLAQDSTGRTYRKRVTKKFLKEIKESTRKHKEERQIG